MRRCLVVGASGFLGRHLLAFGPDWSVVGTAYGRHRDGLLYLDATSEESVARIIDDVRPDAVIYAAGVTSVDECAASPERAQEINCRAPMRIAQRTTGRLIYVSTDYVFDGVDGGYAESAEPRPLNDYGRTKVAGEHAVLSAGSLNAVLRVSGLFSSSGTRQGPFGVEAQSRHRDDDRLSSPVHVEDVRRALESLLSRPEGGVFHAGGAHELSRYEFSQVAFMHGAAASPTWPRLHAGRPAKVIRPANSSLLSPRLNQRAWLPRRCADWLTMRTKAGEELSVDWESLLLGVDAVLVDCVGGVLGSRQWMPRDQIYEAIAQGCEHVLYGGEFWREAGINAGNSSLQEVQQKVAKRYAPNPEIWRVLPILRERKKLALTNNGPSATFRLWVDKYGLDQCFSVLANSEEMGLRKPDERFFKQVASRLGIPPERCLVVDDNDAYLAGAKQCGMRVLHTFEASGEAVSGFSPRRSCEHI